MVANLKMPQQTSQLRYDSNAEAIAQARGTVVEPSYMRLADEPSGAERRIFPRKETHDHIRGTRVDHTIAARREPFLNLALRDISMGGLSAISQTPVGNGERVNVYFPPQGVHRGWDALGRVIRCQPSGFGYRIAVEFDPIPMAA